MRFAVTALVSEVNFAAGGRLAAQHIYRLEYKLGQSQPRLYGRVYMLKILSQELMFSNADFLIESI
jgi:hypothetical protein